MLFFFLPLVLLSVVNTFVSVLSAWWITFEYLIDDVAATWIMVTLSLSLLKNPCVSYIPSYAIFSPSKTDVAMAIATSHTIATGSA